MKPTQTEDTSLMNRKSTTIYSVLDRVAQNKLFSSRFGALMSGFTTLNTPPVSVEPVVIDHITADFMKILYKLDLAEKFYVTEVKERMWDVDEMRNIDDVVGYQVHWTE